MYSFKSHSRTAGKLSTLMLSFVAAVALASYPDDDMDQRNPSDPSQGQGAKVHSTLFVNVECMLMSLKKKKEMARRTITSHQSWKPPLTESTLTVEKSRIRKPDEATLL